MATILLASSSPSIASVRMISSSSSSSSSSSICLLIRRHHARQLCGRRRYYHHAPVRRSISSSCGAHQSSRPLPICGYYPPSLVVNRVNSCFFASYFSSKAGGFQHQQIVYDDGDGNDDKIKITTTIHHQDDEITELRSRLDVAIVGYPNAGKSQLLNALIGTKVAAVSRKRHTTRSGIMGVLTKDDKQVVFCDTPGFMTELPKGDQNQKDLVLSAKGYMNDVDYTLVVIDAAKTKLDRTYLNTITTLMWNAMHASGSEDDDGTTTDDETSSKSNKSNLGIVLNKVDLIKPKKKLLEAAQYFGNMADMLLLEKIKLSMSSDANESNNNPPQQQPDLSLLVEDFMPDVFYTCAKKGQDDEGIQDVLNHLYEISIPNREWMLDEDDGAGKDHGAGATPMDYPARVEEIIREKIYRTLHREIPHQIIQRNRQMELIRGDDTSSSIMMIQQDLLVRSKSHLKVVNAGGNLQRIHDSAVPELRRLFQCEVLLTLKAKLISRNHRR